MAYATVADLKDKATGIRIGGAGGFDAEKVQRIIDSISKQVDATIHGLGFSVPVVQATSPEAYEVVKDIVLAGSIAQVLKAMYYGIRDPEDVGANAAWREYTGKLKALGNPDDPLTLTDAVRIDVADKVTAEISGNFTQIGDYEQFLPTRNQVF